LNVFATLFYMANYVKWIREKVGHEPIFLNVACAIIENEQGEVLFQRRGDFKEEAWGFPGGAMEIGESAEIAMKREVLEETGLEVSVERFLGAYTHNKVVLYPNGDQCQMILFMFVCRPVGGELRVDGGETLELRYVDPLKKPKLFREHLEVAFADYVKGCAGVIH
jgi:mutator protein MutT